MQAYAVIGANFGDEGKGLITDFLARKNGLVIRYNGGGQAGHTVVTPDKERHVFSHFGSGSFKGAATFLSKHFIINPMVWREELSELCRLGINSKVFYSSEAYLTLPYDIMVNQQIERSRGNNRHGSCGLGINETVTRCQRVEFQTTVDGNCSIPTYKKIIQSIRENYYPKRIAELGLTPSAQFWEILNSEQFLDDYLRDLRFFMDSARSQVNNRITKGPRLSNIVFEGAQGLLLDEEHEFFPHVTRSKTGLRNILEICNEADIREINAVYVTRAYMTRHGAGPFPSEDSQLVYKDSTNVFGEFQGQLRFGVLDIDLLNKSIHKDLEEKNKYSILVHPHIALTCVDQLEEEFRVKIKGEIISLSYFWQAIQAIEDETKISVSLFSNGPTRKHVGLVKLTGNNLAKTFQD